MRPEIKNVRGRPNTATRGGNHGAFTPQLLTSLPHRRPLVAGGVFAPAIAQAKPVRIGILAPRTGIAASPGISGLRATRMGGRALQRRTAASPGARSSSSSRRRPSPKDTIERFQKLVQQDKVDCVQGIISTGVALALGPVVEEARALTIFWDGTTQDGVEEKLPNPSYLFRAPTTSARR